MEGKKMHHSPPPERRSSTRRERDTIIDELPPEVTEKMGYVWVVKGTPPPEDEIKMTRFPSRLSQLSVNSEEFARSYCTTRNEKFDQLIRLSDENIKGRKRDSSVVGNLTSFIETLKRFMTSQLGLDENMIRYLEELERKAAQDLERLGAKGMQSPDIPSTSQPQSSSSKPDTQKDLPISQARGSQDHHFLREYILHKLEQLENRLKSVDERLIDSKERQEQLQQQLIELEILKLVEKISKEDTPSEEDVCKLEYLTDQLKIVSGIKQDYGDDHDGR